MTKEELIINSFCKRLPWALVSEFLKKNNLRKGQGSEKTADKLIDDLSKNLFSPNLVTQMDKVYRSYIRFGDKTIAIDTLTPSEISSISSAIKNIQPEVNERTINFPYIDTDTNSHLNKTLSFIKCTSSKNGFLHFYFASTRAITETVIIDDNFLQAKNVNWKIPTDIFDVSGKIVTLRRCYDVVTIDIKNNTLIYQLDAKTASLNDEIEQALKKLISKFQTLFLYPLNISPSRQNVFPAIKNIYDHSIGRVCELGYQVSSVTHLERTRLNDKDLRQEEFHKGGKAKVKSLDVYRIANRYKSKSSKFNIETELLLPGQSSQLKANSAGHLRAAIFTKCLNSDDFRRHIADLI